MKKAKRNYQPLLRCLLVAYGLLMVWLLFGRDSGWREGYSYRELLGQRICLDPFETIGRYWSVLRSGQMSEIWKHCFVNLIGNVIMFIPLGWLLPRVFPVQRNFWLFLVTCLFFDLLIEIIQLLTLLGYFDLGDVILNMSGLLLGYLICMLMPQKKKKKTRKKKK